MDGERRRGSVGRKLTLVAIEIHSVFILILTNVIKLHLTLSFSLSLQLLGKENVLFTAHLGSDS